MRKLFISLNKSVVKFSIVALFIAVSAILTTGIYGQRIESPKTTAVSPVTQEAARETLETKSNPEVETAKAEQSIYNSPELVTAASYPFTNQTGVLLEDMSSGTTQLVGASQDDTASAVTNIGFDFFYDGVRATQFSVNANGLMRLGGTVVSTGFTNSLAATTDAPKIGAYWDDQCTGANGKIHYKVVGSAPNRKLVAEWQNMQITRGAGCAGNGNGTYQVWLFETTGVVEFVYGAIQAASAADGGYSVGLQSGAATNFASVTTSTNTVSYAAANNTQTNAIPTGTAYVFTPVVPSAPTGLNFTATGALTTTLNWTDNSSNEVGFVVSRSTDGGTTYNFLTQTAANATSYTDNTVSPATNYFYQVRAVTEGALSSPVTNSVTTNAAGSISSTAAGGNWSSTATWVGGVVPVNTDNVTIVDGANVIIDTAAVAYTVTVGQGGLTTFLQFENTTARTLTVGTNVLINPNGNFNSGLTGTTTGHILSVGSNLTNNGTLDFSTNSNNGGADITFTGAANNTFGGTGATTDLRTLTINKGSSSASILEITTTNFTVQGVNTDAAGFLTLTNGTLKISGSFTIANRTFTAAAYTIGATTGFWLNNPNYTVAGQNGSPTENGLLRISQGTFNIGTATGNSMGFSTGSTIIVEGGAVNATGRFGVAAAANAITYNQSGGTITVQTIGQTSTTLAGFDLGTSLTSSITISSGTIVVQLASTGATQIDYRNQAGGGLTGVTGGTLQLGNANSGAAKAFVMRGVVPNLVLTNTSANHTASFSTTLVNYNNLSLNITINTGTTLNLGNVVFLFDGTTLTNNGTLTHNGASSNFVVFNAAAPVTYTGTGTVTAPMSNLAIQADQGFTIDPASPNIVAGAIRLFSGSVTNSNKLTLGNGGATTGTVQIGNTTTPTAAGTFDVPLTFNLGTGGQVVSYLRTTTSRTTGGEINPTRTLTTFTYDDNDATHTLTIAGGNLTVTGATTLTNGRIVTNANTFIIGGAGTVTRTNGYIDGNLQKTYAAIANKTFEVGTANGYSPAAANVTAGTFPSTLTVKAVNATLPGLTASTAVSRYWTLTEGGDITADLSFTYLDPADVNGSEAGYVVFKREAGVTSQVTPSSNNAATNTATAPGISNFSDWGIGTMLAPTAAHTSISGRVLTATGNGIINVLVTMTDSSGNLHTTLTGKRGFYRFDDVAVGETYVISVFAKRYIFSQSSQLCSIVDETTDVNFVAINR